MAAFKPIAAVRHTFGATGSAAALMDDFTDKARLTRGALYRLLPKQTDSSDHPPNEPHGFAG